ncbi:TlpA family protein disulfide reductase [Chitinophaga ginsengisegetis]|uniref:TlpA family protein disulfide reductase n=1 Tax=Chitinophaga ginsengisegetis TaxID=393003 RepID=UPI000DBAA88D|nr:TlpA disulfide reductase family protein [Chitinophaga ginsengisegetis]MDR6570248.1 thiol-disulfide isomerase/thioredoxin [Chitinophaga ginsengisegetis]MDR6649982.1 thiol-disulfide isomerase/thioredoxin [Chitinophaga ginsengisegetis]MDR6656377.1 thiol-disulfide isomerase/thioredoxin [Chitinophaga ginsengisegetis]
MPKYLLLLVYLALACSPVATIAQLKFKKNDSWRYQLTVKDSFPPHIVQEVEKIVRVTITGNNPDGSTNAVYVLESVAVHGSGANFNSADPDTYAGEWRIMEFMQLLHQPLEFKIFPNDSISEPGNTAAVAKAAAASLGLTSEMEDALAGNWKFLQVELKFLFPTSPKQLAVNDEWKESPWKFRVVNAEKDLVEVAGTPEENNSDSVVVTGAISYTLSRNKGNVQKFRSISRQATRNGKVLTARDVNILPSPPKALPADTAWANTLVRMSGLSNSLKVNGESDSAKIAQFLAVTTPKYGNRLAFKLAKLDIYGSGSEYMYEQYQHALKDLPSAALAGSSSHLFNKLQNTYYQNPDSAMVLLKLLSADRGSLDSWLDQSFAQYLPQHDFDTTEARQEFRSRGVSEARIAEIFEESRKAPAGAQLLMTRMMAEKDSILQVSLRPMSLWNKAMYTTDTAILKSIAADFGQISPAEMTLGKAARYELLVQDILRKANMPAAADALLDKALTDLKNNQADTAFWTAHPELQNKKAANKNILSHAYYLKYEHTKASDKKTALNYLALAAGIAPKSNAEKAHESFYDRHFLHSEENYSAHFAKELEALGKPEEAMRVLSKQLTAQPDMLDSTRAFFNAHFPGKSFNAYFRDVLLKEWEDAPDFTLKGMNNENIRLADYRGKWLLLDFWGTWCAPCRKDLPHLNQLAEEINAGKYPGNAILAVSCREPIETTRSFITANKYIFPAAHADDKIEKSYKIKGYPTKVLVSPDGKMLDLQFGADYASILQAYSNAYFTQEKEQPSTIRIDNKKKD